MKYLLTSAVLLLLPAVAAAQSSSAQEIDEVRKNARAHAGPFYVTPLIQLRELGMDSNVFNTADDQKSDFTFTLVPKADVWVPVARRALLRGTAATDLVWFSKYESERSVDPQFTGRLELYLHRVTLFVEDAYLNTRQRPNYEVDVRSRHVENDALAGIDIGLTPKFSVEAAVRRFDNRYDADDEFDGTSLQKTLNRETTGYRLIARHRVTPLTTLALRYENLRDRFEFSPARDADSYSVMPGLEFRPRALISGSAYIGYREFTPQHPLALPPFSGLVAQLGLSYTLLGSTTFGVTFRRDLTYSYEELQPFFVNTSIGASIRRALGGRFDVLVSADRHRYEYQNALVLPGDIETRLDPRLDTTWSYGGSLGYRIGRGGRVGVGASYWQRESTTRRFRDYDNLRFGTSITYGF